MSKRIKLDIQSSSSSLSNKTPWGRLITCYPGLESVDLIDENISLGRSEGCDIVIFKSIFPRLEDLLLISKKHFDISQDPHDEYITYITDHSKNGTYVNNKRIGKRNKIILQNNDTISLGDKLQVYVFKTMKFSVVENYLPEDLKMKYVTTRLLGKGACGEVRLAYDKITCKQYAVKKMTKGRDTPSQIHSVNHPRRLETEIKILQSLCHPLVIKMEEISETDEDVFVILEYVKGGELSKRLSSSTLSESHSKFLFYQIVLAVHYLHTQGVTHRDLKPGNVLLASSSPYSLIKLTDFGLSKIAEDYSEMRTVCGTWSFMAPEVLNPNVREYDNQVDVWSLGVILFCMLSKTLPFQSRDKAKLMYLIVNGKYKMESSGWSNISQEAKDVVRKMLLVNPKERITVDGILNHPWIKRDSLLQYRVEQLMKSQENRSKSPPLQEEDVPDGVKRLHIDC